MREGIAQIGLRDKLRERDIGYGVSNTFRLRAREAALLKVLNERKLIKNDCGRCHRSVCG